jgi:hypothetical protein
MNGEENGSMHADLASKQKGLTLTHAYTYRHFFFAWSTGMICTRAYSGTIAYIRTPMSMSVVIYGLCLHVSRVMHRHVHNALSDDKSMSACTAYSNIYEY